MADTPAVFYALAAIAFAAAGSGSVKSTSIASAVVLGAGFLIAGAVGIAGFRLDANVMTTIVVFASFAHFTHLRVGLICTLLASGFVAGAGAAELFRVGVAWPVAVLLMCGVLFVPWTLTKRSADFAPDDLRDEAVIVVAAIAVISWAIPSIIGGWETAITLNIGDGTVLDEPGTRMPMLWVAVVAIVSVCAGIVTSRRGHGKYAPGEHPQRP